MQQSKGLFSANNLKSRLPLAVESEARTQSMAECQWALEMQQSEGLISANKGRLPVPVATVSASSAESESRTQSTAECQYGLNYSSCQWCHCDDRGNSEYQNAMIALLCSGFATSIVAFPSETHASSYCRWLLGVFSLLVSSSRSSIGSPSLSTPIPSHPIPVALWCLLWDLPSTVTAQVPSPTTHRGTP